MTMKSGISKIIEPFALAHVRLIVGDAKGTVLPDMTVLVGAHGRIERVSPSFDTPFQTNTIILTVPENMRCQA